ncbi:MAG: acylphosphatase [bacterium]
MDVGVVLIVKGRVQGVGFRWYVQRAAQKLGLTGYVKNLYNGDVEVVAEGERGRVEELIQQVKIGPSFSKVNDVFIEWKKITGTYSSFSVEY